MDMDLSGPISMYLLKHKRDSGPPIFLFGDRHGADDRRCGGLARAREGDKTDVDKKEFYESLASRLPLPDTFPLDVFVEDYVTMPGGPSLPLTTPLGRIQRLSDKGGAKSVRWHKVDIRHGRVGENGRRCTETHLGSLAAPYDLDGRGRGRERGWGRGAGASIERDGVDRVAARLSKRVVDHLVRSGDSSCIVRSTKETPMSRPFGSARFLEHTLRSRVVADYAEVHGRRGVSPADCLAMSVQNWFVDVYTVLRMLRAPVAGFMGGLCVGYHGATHTRNIVDILEASGEYETVHSESTYEASVSKNGHSRCMQTFGTALGRLDRPVEAWHRYQLGRLTSYGVYQASRYQFRKVGSAPRWKAFWARLAHLQKEAQREQAPSGAPSRYRDRSPRQEQNKNVLTIPSSPSSSALAMQGHGRGAEPRGYMSSQGQQVRADRPARRRPV